MADLSYTLLNKVNGPNPVTSTSVLNATDMTHIETFLTQVVTAVNALNDEIESASQAISELQDAGYVTSTEVLTAISSALNTYVNESELETALEPYAKSEDLTTALTSYYTSSQVDTALEAKQDVSSLVDDINTAITNGDIDVTTAAELSTALEDYVLKTSLSATNGATLIGATGGTVQSVLTELDTGKLDTDLGVESVSLTQDDTTKDVSNVTITLADATNIEWNA